MRDEHDINTRLATAISNVISEAPDRGAIVYGHVEMEVFLDQESDALSVADIVVYDEESEPVIVIESRLSGVRSEEGYFDPYHPDLIKETRDYAFLAGAPYFVTFDSDRAGLFGTFSAANSTGGDLTDLNTSHFYVESYDGFAENLVNTVASLERGREDWDRTIGSAFGKSVKALQNDLRRKRLRQSTPRSSLFISTYGTK